MNLEQENYEWNTQARFERNAVVCIIIIFLLAITVTAICSM